MSHVAERTVAESVSPTSHPGLDPIVLAMKPFTGTAGPLAVAQWIAVRAGRPLHLVSVLDPFEGADAHPDIALVAPRYVEEARSEIASRIFESLTHSPYAKVDTRVEVVDGGVAPSLDRVAHDRHASLLVIGTGRKGGLRHGQMAQQVLRTARVPVLLVPPDAEARPLRHAVAAVDFSPASQQAATLVLPMLAEGGTLTLCHVQFTPLTAHARVANEELEERSYTVQCEESFGRMVRALPVPPGVTVKTKVLFGEPVARINELVAQEGADILVCGRRNQRAAARLLLGSVSSGLVHQSRIPVLVTPDVPADAAELRVEPIPANAQRPPAQDWAAVLHDFTRRHRGARLRTEMSGTLPGDPCVVTQDYELVDVSCEPDGSRVSLTLGDPRTVHGQLSLWIPDVRAIAMVHGASPADWRLILESAHGRAELRLADEASV